MQQKTGPDLKLPKILRGCLRGREAIQIALHKHFYAYGLSICLRYSASKESAKEILNDAFLKVFLKIEQYDNSYEFKPWLRKILIYTAVDHQPGFLLMPTSGIKIPACEIEVIRIWINEGALNN